MNYINLSAEAMLILSGEIVDPNGDFRAKLEADTYLAGPCALLVQAHEELLPAYEKAGNSEMRIKYLTEKMTELDAAHDQDGSATYQILEALIELYLGTPKEKVYRNLKQILFPKGRSIVRRSYREQAGTAKRVQNRITDTERDLLRNITFGNRNLLDVVEKWLATARRIARKQSERTRLENRKGEDTVSASEVQQARFFWINAIDALVNMVEYSELDEDDKEDLLANLREATQNAKRRQEAAAARQRQDDEQGDGAEQIDDTEEVDVEDQTPSDDGDEDSEVIEPAE